MSYVVQTTSVELLYISIVVNSHTLRIVSIDKYTHYVTYQKEIIY